MRAVLFLALLALTAGCAHTIGRRIVEAQTPGTATGAGATLTGPANSATPTKQTAERKIAYHRPVVPPAPAALPPIDVTAPAVAPPGQPAIPAPEPVPAWIYEKTETTLGQHQDAAGIVKVAATMAQWSSVKWMGLFCIVAGLFGIAWSYKNEESGYPLVYIKVAAVGVFLVMVADNPAWLLLLLLPLGFYAAQKFNLLRLP